MRVELDVTQSILLTPGEGEVTSDRAEHHLEILCDQPGLVATWTRVGPGRDGASAHVHRAHSDLFYVLAGELTVLVGPEREEHVLPAGTLVLAPPLVVHGFRNGGDDELRYLNFHAPGGGFADYLRGLTPGFDSEEPPADGGRPATNAVIVPPGTDGVLVDRDEIRIEVRDEPEPSTGRLTCLYALDDGRVLEIQA
jgi:mannose-6-phosphate isomerase-like protein (cupin superfamily)